jgi:hypothetical protein
MSIRKLRACRVPGVKAAEYIGIAGTIFWNENTGELRLSNGSTAGGVRVGFPVASSTALGGIKLGPGVILNQDNQVIIDNTGLDFSFGDLASTTGTYTDESDYAILQTINLNEDLVLASNGTGGIHIVGEFRINKTNGSLTAILEAVPVFEVKADGQVKILVPAIDSTEGAVSIVGSSTGAFISPVNNGVMLHITGQYDTPAIPSRIYNDSQNTFAAFVARRFNGTVASPTAVLADEEIMRISGTSHNGTTIPGTGQARIVYKALGNQTISNQGGYIELWTTPLNSTTIAKIATINNVDGITATKFVGPLTGNVTGKADTAGNADTVTNGVITTGSYSDPSWLTISKSKVGLGSVENTALSTWAGSSNITTVGTLTNLSVTNKITGSINGNADGSAGSVAAANITGTTLASNVVTSSLTALGGMGTIKAGTISAAFNVPKNTPISTQTFTVSGLTTSHKLIITSNTAMPDETYNIAAAWVSATNTVSIQIAHTGGGAFTATFNISYFAWV